MIPAMQIVEGNSEAIGDGDERIAVASLVDFRMACRSGRQRHRDHKGIHVIQRVIGMELVNGGQLFDRHVITVRDAGK